MRFRRQLGGGIDAELAAETGFRRRKIKVVDGCTLDHRQIPARIDVGRQRPDHVIPIAGVDVVVNHDHELGIHELTQVRPNRHHHALGMTGICFFHRHHGDTVRAALGRQPKIDDFRKLLLQQRHEYVVQCLPQDRRLVGRTTGVCRQVNRVFAHGDRGDAEHRERLNRIIIAGVITVRAFVAVIAERDLAFDHDLGRRWHFEGLADAVDKLDFLAPEQAGELILRQRIGDWRHGGQNGAGIRAEHGGGGQRRRIFVFPTLVMLRPAPMLQPAHQRGVFAGHLHPIDTQVRRIALVAAGALARSITGALRDHQRPRDQRRRLARPTGLDRELMKINVITAPNDFLAIRRRCHFRLHRHHGFQQRQHFHRFAPAARRLRLTEKSKRFADFAQLMGLAVHPPCDALNSAEQIYQHRHFRALAIGTDYIFEQDRWATLGDDAGLDFRHFEDTGDRRCDTDQPSGLFKALYKLAKRRVSH